MSSTPADDFKPSPYAEKALQVIRRLSNRDRIWIYEQIESLQTLNVEELSSEWRAEISHRIRSLDEGTAELYDLDEVEQQALRMLDR
ncbi:MAG: addiction module protein [Deltaproteobacteria bacterium]|nr:addiction module protein [Deltaproteobacteria bacterium]